MPVSINFNICDNSPECSGLAVCECGAIYWDENKKNLLGKKGILCVDNEKCISCEKCIGEEGCPVGAIVFANTQRELDEIMDDVHIDTEKVKALFVERYGAEAVDEQICISADDISCILKDNKGIVVVEEFCDSSIQCMLTSIPIEDILQEIRKHTMEADVKYYKCDVTDNQENGVEYPILKVFRGNEIIAQIVGYYDNDQKEGLFSALSEVIK